MKQRKREKTIQKKDSLETIDIICYDCCCSIYNQWPEDGDNDNDDGKHFSHRCNVVDDNVLINIFNSITR
ncbi:hypothetical protein DERP_013536 [Dermatophagoides pteronyssinus]|uniref:Uncharacterized protein n=1 Tax=Dermatophagoides pteronyssinus TaxID=6956 RepID=A0ABQ8IXL8_DERPT|nr:hypothetical protein DERP_013536 [Dermatophagoides pteronyssinus]